MPPAFDMIENVKQVREILRDAQNDAMSKKG
jgi:hypothetical protein